MSAWGNGPVGEGWRDRFDKLQEPDVRAGGDPLLDFVITNIVRLETAPRVDIDMVYDQPGGPTAYRYARHMRDDCVVFRRIVAQYVEVTALTPEIGVDVGRKRQARDAVLAIANRWSDDPDFREEWRV